MIISIAQTRPIKGDIAANIIQHKNFVALASSFEASAVFFPELSLTGYEPTLAQMLATNQDDKRLDLFEQMSNADKITIGVGIPAKTDAGIHISMIIFQPGKPRQTYSKQQLHSDEFPFFVKGARQIMLSVNNKKITPAICYESLQPEHAINASKMGAEIYVASVAKSASGVNKALRHFPEVAKTFSMPVLMANCVGACDNFQSVGKSSVWTKRGKLAGQLDDQNEGMLFFNTERETAFIQAS